MMGQGHRRSLGVGLRDGAARTNGLGSTCSVSDDANHNHDSNDTGNHAATTPFPIPRIIGVSDRSGVWICHADLRGGLTPEGLTGFLIATRHK